MEQDSAVRNVSARLLLYAGVPVWWAEYLVNLGLDASDAETFVLTAQADKNSPLYRASEVELNATLKSFAEARGVELIGTGSGPGVGGAKLLSHCVTTVCTPLEQDAIVKEVSCFADVTFREKLNGVYTSHAVANAVRHVHECYLYKLVPKGARVLNLGASVKAMVSMGLDPESNHGCAPVLCVRDSVRHSIGGYLDSVLHPDSSWGPKSKKAASAVKDVNSEFVCRCKGQVCSWDCDYIVSNESTHDVPFEELPDIMARHGAKTWIGFSTRARGLHRSNRVLTGGCSVMSSRWHADPRTDQITFHFAKDSSFSYVHKLSEWMKYEEKTSHRWFGRYFDYVYMRLPITTEASLAFMIARVPKAGISFRELSYVPTKMQGMVKITSVKAVGSCVGSSPRGYDPVEFFMEHVVWDKVMETRMMLGDRGGLPTTMAYMRSVRVRMIVNGVALGAESKVPSDILESAAVAVEVLAADNRVAMTRDFSAILEAAAPSGSLLKAIASWLGSTRGGVTALAKTLCAQLIESLTGDQRVVVKVEPCSGYQRVDGVNESVMKSENPLKTSACVCDELRDVRAAILVGSALSFKERQELEEYKSELESVEEKCVKHTTFYNEDAEVVEPTKHEQTNNSVSGESSDTSTKVGTEVSDYWDCASEQQEGGVDEEESSRYSYVQNSVREYVDWAVAKDKASRSEAALFASVLFHGGNPTKEDVERATTGRTRHGVVGVVGGAIKSIVGSMLPEDDYSELYSPIQQKVYKVFNNSGGRKYIKDNITELCYTSTQLQVMNGEALARGAARALQDLPVGYKMPKYKFINGVPGCGKTYEFVQKIKKYREEGKSVMYLTETVASAEKVWQDAYGRDPAMRKYCATYGSYLCSTSRTGPPGGGTFDYLFMDEVPMSHAGAICACILLVKAYDVVMAGDRHQINADSYMADYEWNFSKIWHMMEIEERVVTHRFGAPTCAMWLDVYGEIFPCTCCEHDESLPQVVRISGDLQMTERPDVRFLTFTQEEKGNVKREVGFVGSLDSLRKNEAAGLSTIGEDQGGTHNGVNLIRLVNRKNPKESEVSPSIYNRQPWVLVGTTRSRRPVTYYTAADADMTTARIALAACSVRLSAVVNRIKWKDVERDATPPPRFGAWGV